TSQSTAARNTPKKNTVAITIPVVDTTSSRLGQVTCFISTRTSCRNSLVSVNVVLTFSPMPEAVEPIPDSSFFALIACVAIFLVRYRRVLCRPVRHGPAEFLAGEEGFEPPYPVLETGVLTVGRLP